ncbi:MAG: hypothetical protein U7127_01050 [Phormidium sp.]
MKDSEVRYITDSHGNQTAVVIPIDLWRKILPEDSQSIETITESIEDYCLNKAMNEAKETPLLSREQALESLAEAED